MNKLAKELINDNSFDFFSNYQEINLREDKKSLSRNYSNNKGYLISTSLERQKKILKNGNYKGSECAEKIANLYDHVIKNYYNYLMYK